MSLTTLDSKTALILVDLQKDIVAMPVAHPIGEVLQNAAALAEAFRGYGLPVVLVQRGPGRAGAAPSVRPA